jgi:hypothetical protein
MHLHAIEVDWFSKDTYLLHQQATLVCFFPYDLRPVRVCLRNIGTVRDNTHELSEAVVYTLYILEALAYEVLGGSKCTESCRSVIEVSEINIPRLENVRRNMMHGAIAARST